MDSTTLLALSDELEKIALSRGKILGAMQKTVDKSGDETGAARAWRVSQRLERRGKPLTAEEYKPIGEKLKKVHESPEAMARAQGAMHGDAYKASATARSTANKGKLMNRASRFVSKYKWPLIGGGAALAAGATGLALMNHKSED